jgi:hypothetical protein
MFGMLRVAFAVTAGILALAPALSVGAATTAAASTATPPPQIYHIVTRPLCSELHERIAPAIGMLLQNDTTIKKSPALFKQYNLAALNGPDAGQVGQKNPLTRDPGSGGAGTMNMSQNMALLGMENLIRPIANNVIAIETMLDSPELLNGTGRQDDDKRLQEIRAKLLKALAAQKASLDIISGFVDTQQMADLQHSDEGFISAINQPDTQHASSATPGPNPLTVNPNYAGLPPNPYAIDPATIPGLTLGYNPVTHLVDGLTWSMDQAQTRENDAAKAVMSSAVLCGNVPAPSPSP